MTPKFIYFDLGRVLVDFDLDRMVTQMAQVAGVEPEAMHRVLFETGLELEYELGRVTTDEFFAKISDILGCEIDRQRLELACNDMFTVMPQTQKTVAWLRESGYRLGILSNTCDCHWEFCRRKFSWIDEHFEVHITSHQVGAMKPDHAIYRVAAERAECRPEQIVFIDDMLANVEGAHSFGFDAIQYTTGTEVDAALRRLFIM